MLRRYLMGISAFLLMSASLSAQAADYVTSVYECGNTELIYLKSGKVLWVWLSETSQDNYDHIYAMALELLASGKQIGYYNNLNNTGTVCGVPNAQEIDVMQATNAS